MRLNTVCLGSRYEEKNKQICYSKVEMFLSRSNIFKQKNEYYT